jgi:hypothetical protein
MARNFVRTSSQYLSNANAVVAAAPCSMACWFNTADLTNTKVWMGIEDAALSHKFVMFSTGSDTILAGTGGTEGFSSAGSGTFSDNIWNHACAVYASSSSRLAYLNGTPGAANTATRTPASLSQTLIGGEVSASFADGDMAEAAIWNVALSAADVVALATGVSPLLVQPDGLVAYWPLLGRHDPEIDRVGGFNMTLNAAPIAAAHPRVFMPSSGLVVPAHAAAAAGRIMGGMVGRGGLVGIGGGMVG